MNTFRKIRNRLGLTQESLGKSLGVTQGNIAHYERGQTVPPDTAKKLIAVAKDLGHELTLDDVYADEIDEQSSTEPAIELSSLRRRATDPKPPP